MNKDLVVVTTDCLYTKCAIVAMIRRLNRKLVFAAKVTALVVGVTLIWLYLSAKTIEDNNHTIYNQLIRRQSNESTLKIINQNVEKSIEELRKSVETLNENQRVFNRDAFGPLSDSDLVLVVQVHNRIQYLSSLIRSLERTKDISRALVVFSHDVFDPQINSLIESIKFCKVCLKLIDLLNNLRFVSKVIQIFYPHSLQLNPNAFPGQSPDDCPRDISRQE